MIYVLDTNVIRSLIIYIPRKGKSFEAIWQKIEDKIQCGEYISVDECYNELEKQFSNSTEQYEWFYSHKEMFKNPSNEESIVISKLLQKPKMRESIRLKNIIDNRPAADLYIVAKAKTLGATVVTSEKFKPNSAQLPNLCKELNVEYINYSEFLEMVDS